MVFGKDAKLMTAVFTAESGLTCKAVGDGHIAYVKNGVEYGKSYGTAQIRYLPGRPSPAQLHDCKFNIDYAYQIFKKQGCQPWSACANKSYQKYLTQ